MGEPAELTEAEIAALVDYATKLVGSVRDDEEEPALPRFADGDLMRRRT